MENNLVVIFAKKKIGKKLQKFECVFLNFPAPTHSPAPTERGCSVWITYTLSSEQKRGISRGWNTNFHKIGLLFKIRKIRTDFDTALIYIYILFWHVITIELRFISLFMKFIFSTNIKILQSSSNYIVVFLLNPT